MIESLSTNNKELSLGQYLKKVRSEKLITVEEIASITKISLNLLTALENDVADELPAPPFVKGFIKSYTRYVGVDPKIALNIYEQSAPMEQTAEEQPIDKLSERKGISLDRLRMSKYSYLFITVVLIFSLTIFALLIIKGLKNDGAEYTTASNPSMIVSLKGPTTEQQPIFQISETIEEQPPVPTMSIGEKVEQKNIDAKVDAKVDNKLVAKAETQLPITKLPEIKKTEIKKEAKTELPKETKEQTLEQKILNQSVVEKEQIVDIIAKENVWVKVQSDELDPFDFVLKSGQVKVVKAQKEIKMMFGDAGAVSLKYNGRIIESIGEKGSVRSLVFPGLGRWKGAMQ